MINLSEVKVEVTTSSIDPCVSRAMRSFPPSIPHISFQNNKQRRPFNIPPGSILPVIIVIPLDVVLQTLNSQRTLQLLVSDMTFY